MIVFTLILEEFDEFLGGGNGNGNLEANVIASHLGGNKPAFLIGFLGEIPGLVKGAGNIIIDN